MGDIINLRTVRKRRSRDEQARQAEQNRIVHGRTKAEKLRDEKEAAQSQAHLDGHRLTRDDETPDF